jgi:hypothetical protein
MWDWNVERARNECPDGTPVSDFNSPRELNDYLRGMNESDYDSGEYPKWCSDDEESDCPQHCADCGYFFGNSLTSEGADYVISAVNESRLDGDDNPVTEEWAECYDYLDFVQRCDGCGEYADLDDEYLCAACAEKEGFDG